MMQIMQNIDAINAGAEMHDHPSRPVYRILSLDGGGAKGFYTIGILDELEKNIGKPLHECFDLIFGTSTGSIIAALLARGDSVPNSAILLAKLCQAMR